MIERIIKDNGVFESYQDIMNGLQYFIEVSNFGLENLNDKEIFDLKGKFSNFFNIDLALQADIYPETIYRVTNNKYLLSGKKEKLQNISQLIGPQKGTNYNRCNLPGESIFYGAFELRTALWESQPQKGDYITVSEWKLKPDKKLYNSFIFQPNENNINIDSSNAYKAFLTYVNEMPKEVSFIIMELHNFIAGEFMKIVTEKVNYLFSAIISSKILQSVPDENKFRIDSITYPSIKRDHISTNIAILNSLVLERLDLVAVTVYTVGNVYYDEDHKYKDDFIEVYPFQSIAREFDIENNLILYDLKKELQDAMALVNENRNETANKKQ